MYYIFISLKWIQCIEYGLKSFPPNSCISYHVLCSICLTLPTCFLFNTLSFNTYSTLLNRSESIKKTLKKKFNDQNYLLGKS
jgi:hypothetical protein